MPTIRSYQEMKRFKTFEDRFDYLNLRASVGASTFGFDRYLNQQFYSSVEWKRVRDHVIIRDNGQDLGCDGYEIHDKIVIHHMNPIKLEDLEDGNPDILEPDFLITTTHRTHNAIHFGNKDHLINRVVERKPGDTKLW